MEEILRQLGGLLLAAIPTIILFLLLFVAYRRLVHVPLEKVLALRRARTEGALEQARADIAAAEARTAEYEQRLREARISIFKSQEARRQQALQARAALIAEIRAQADAHVNQHKALLAQDVALSKANLQAEADRLASAIIESLLGEFGVAQHPAGGSQ